MTRGQEGSSWRAKEGRGTIKLKSYPDLKIGFTTANFLRALPVTLENTKKLIDFASDQGFSWIELRDPNAVLTLEECKQIADYARGKKIQIGYAMAVGLMDANFEEVFSRGLANAAVFEGPQTARASCGGNEFNVESEENGLDPRRAQYPGCRGQQGCQSG